MNSVNIRLTAADAEIVKSLKKRGISITELFRRALREESQQQERKPLTAKEVQETLAALHAAYPTPDDMPRVRIDPTDRRAMSKYITDYLRRKRGR